MPQYLLSVHTGETQDVPPDESAAQDQFQEMAALEEDMKATGAWLFSGRLTDADVATLVRVSGGETFTTDGPFAESKEHLAGFYIVEAGDLDAALGWATRTAAIIGMPALPRGVRPVGGRPGPVIRTDRHRRGRRPGRLHTRPALLATGRHATPTPAAGSPRPRGGAPSTGCVERSGAASSSKSWRPSTTPRRRRWDRCPTTGYG